MEAVVRGLVRAVVKAKEAVVRGLVRAVVKAKRADAQGPRTPIKARGCMYGRDGLHAGAREHIL